MRWWPILVIAACTKADDPATTAAATTTVRVVRGAVAERVFLTGELRAGISVELNVPKTDAWELTIKWMADDGTLVKAGDRVLEFDNSSFIAGLDQKRVAAKEAASAFATARDVSAMALADKKFELQQHTIALDKAKIRASVPVDLLPQRDAQERQLEKLKMEVAAERAAKELEAQRQAASLEDRVKQIDLEKAKRAIEDAEKTIGDLVVKAPRDGVIAIGDHPWEDRRFQVGDTTQPGMTVITLPDFTQPMEVRADLSDVDDGRIAIGMTGTCTLDAYPGEPLPCKIVELAPVARTKNRQSLRRGFAVKLAIENRDPERMRPGMSVKVELPRPKIEQALLVPRGAVIGATKMQVKLGGGELRDVTVGACDAKHCEILKGLADTDSVLVGGS